MPESEALKAVADAVQRSLEKLDALDATVGEMRVEMAMKAETAALAAVEVIAQYQG